MIGKRVYVQDLFTYDLLHRLELKNLDGGNHKTQNNRQSVVNSVCSLCYVTDMFIVKSPTKRHCILHRVFSKRAANEKDAAKMQKRMNWNFYKIKQLTRTSS